MKIPLFAVTDAKKFRNTKILVRYVGIGVWFGGAAVAFVLDNTWIFFLGFFLAWFCFYVLIGIIFDIKQ